MRQIILDTETTGLEPADGHRVIEIGCVELIDRRLTGRHFHQYLNPERDIEDGALEVHGISGEFLADKPVFAEVVDEFLAFIEGAELLIHNAPFDLAFLDAELALLGRADRVADHAAVIDTLELARELHPGQRNSLDALCKRYEIDDSNRTLHGALLDAGILADVYLAMTGGQSDLGLSFDPPAGPVVPPGHAGSGHAGSGRAGVGHAGFGHPPPADRPALKVLLPSPAEIAAHEARLHAIHARAGHCLWYEL
jgi:DNA polymerase-3 subunit epsilon